VKTQESADIASGCFLILLGIIVLVAASQIRGGMEERLPPRTLPYMVGGDDTHMRGPSRSQGTAVCREGHPDQMAGP
jgi:hypothetical protein